MKDSAVNMDAKTEEKVQTEEGLIDIAGLFTDYFRTFRRMWAWVLILAVLGGVFAYVRSYVSWSPRYTASATFTITISQDTSSTSGSYSCLLYTSDAADD